MQDPVKLIIVIRVFHNFVFHNFLYLYYILVSECI